METNLIALEQFCTYYHVECSFLESLEEYGLIEIVPVENDRFIYEHRISEVEKMIRLYYDLDINMAGIDAIVHLLKRVDEMQKEIRVLKNSL